MIFFMNNFHPNFLTYHTQIFLKTYFTLNQKLGLTAEHALIGDSQNPYAVNTVDGCNPQCFNLQ